ncbi:MAG: NAD(P)-binding domain-containing protein [Anaerolineae bacterium]|nr:NAD(P)-binding domain-containing protein [Anaerolineae bacterium]
MSKIYTVQDAALETLQGETLAVLGYGRLGRPLAWNLRDSGCQVIVGSRPDHFAAQARAEGFEVLTIPLAAQQATLLLLTMPDEALPLVYLESIAPHLRQGNMLIFASGYNLAYRFVEPPIFVDVGLLAPRTLASTLRENFLNEQGFPTFLYLHQQTTPRRHGSVAGRGAGHRLPEPGRARSARAGRSRAGFVLAASHSARHP